MGRRPSNSTDRADILTSNMWKQARCPTFQAASEGPIGERGLGSDDRCESKLCKT